MLASREKKSQLITIADTHFFFLCSGHELCEKVLSNFSTYSRYKLQNLIYGHNQSDMCLFVKGLDIL